MRTSILLASAVTALGLALSGAAIAQDGPTLYKTKTCIACHGPDGAKPIMPTYPRIAGQNKDYAINQMKDIKSGARNNGQTAAMKGVMHLVSDEEIAILGEWLSTLKP
jgi:cytochrome c